MTDARFAVVGLGSAIVDVLAHCDDEFIADQGLTKGTMALIDAERAHSLYDQLGPAIEASGGSCANTMAGLASLGEPAAFIGRIADDTFGEIFAHDLRAAGVEFTSVPVKDHLPTARSYVLVTPDAERTMNTFLGIAPHMEPDDLDGELIEASQILYVEGYLWDEPHAKATCRRAIEIAKGAGRRVAFSMSDTFCVDRHRTEFGDLLADCDLVFANESEVASLYRTERFDDAIDHLADRVEAFAVTRGAAGSVVRVGGDRAEVPAVKVGEVVDTTGAGDLYAAGFLHGWVRGRSAELCARYGSICAGEVISHLGARPETSLADLLTELA